MSVLKDHEEKWIGSTSNEVGNLYVMVKDGVPYWSIENYDNPDWERIPVSLYKQLIKYDEESE